MKKYLPVMILGVVAAVVGWIIRSYAPVAGLCLFFGGLLGLLGAVCCGCLYVMEKRCPSCGKRIRISASAGERPAGTMMLCPNCKSMIRIEHLSIR